jgi:hypothetical protein
MLTILYTGILTLFVLILMHHLYNYLKSSLTIPKVDDVISVHKKKYDEIHTELDNDKNKDELQEYLNQFKQHSPI